jgi:GH25 family lysozyme M1 (1,4-beta-N-acetylmuramidase)
MIRTRLLAAVATAAAVVVVPLATSGPATAAPSDYSVTGVDVSHYQGTINWGSVAGAGIDFAYAKVSEGTGYTDPTYTTNRTGARNAGILFGAYHFGRPDQGDPRGQADRLVSLSQYAHDGRTLPPMLDIEWGPAEACYGLSTSAMVSWISAFVDQVRVRTGQRPMIYTNINWWNPCTGSNAGFGANPLFVARYANDPGTMPPGWSTWTLWQHTSSGSVPGISGNVDRDVFNGTSAQLGALVGGGGVTPARHDFNGDGHNDIIGRNATNTNLYLYGGNGAGGFIGDDDRLFGTSWGGFDIIFTPGDFTGDGKPDILARHATNKNLYLYEGNGAGGLIGGSGRSISTNWSAFDIIFSPGDFSGDGRPDVIARNATDKNLYLYKGNGAGGFIGETDRFLNSNWSAFDTIFSPGDFTGDGKADIIARNATDKDLYLYKGNGAGGFIGETDRFLSNNWSAFDTIFSPGDFTGDGYADIIARDTANKNLYLYKGNGAGGFLTGGSVFNTGWSGFNTIF